MSLSAASGKFQVVLGKEVQAAAANNAAPGGDTAPPADTPRYVLFLFADGEKLPALVSASTLPLLGKDKQWFMAEETEP